MNTASMMKPTWRKVLSDLIGNPVRTLLVVASIAVGVFAVGTIAASYWIIPSEMNAAYESANPPNIEIRTMPFDDDLLDAVEHTPGVLAAEGRASVSVRMVSPKGELVALELTALSSFAPERIDGWRAVSGVQEPDENEVVIDKKAAERYDLQPEDVLEIELGDGTRRTLTVSGVAQELTAGIGGMFNNARGQIALESMEGLRQPMLYNQLLVTAAELPNDRAHIDRLSLDVEDKLEKAGYDALQVSKHLRNKHPMESILTALLRILMILGVLIVFLSGSLISNTLSALLNQHLTQIGIMKLVGARRNQITRMYLLLILAFGFIALLISAPAGAWAGYALSAFAGSLIGFPLSGFHVEPGALIVQTVIALGVPLLAGSLPVVRGSRVTVKKAINSSAIENTGSAKRGLIDRGLAGLRGFSRVALVSVRNTFRRKSRLALTLLTLTLGGAIFISVFNVQVALNHKIEQITKYFGADVNLDLARNYPIDRITALIEKIPGVTHVEPWAMTQGDLLDADGVTLETISLLAPPSDSPLVKPIVMEGRWILPEDENAIAINDAFLDIFPDIKVGDTVRMKVAGEEGDWVIVGLYQFTGVDDLIVYTNYDHLSRILHQPDRAAAFRIASDDHNYDAQAALTLVVDELMRTEGVQVRSVEAGGEFTQSMTDYISILTAFLVVMALLTALVGSIGMAGTLSMNVMERTREIGVLRAIGAHDGVILRLVLMEGMLIGAISFVFGALLSFPITSLLSEVISQAIFNSPANFALTGQGFLVWLTVVAALSASASLIPARSASRMTIREVLAYE